MQPFDFIPRSPGGSNKRSGHRPNRKCVVGLPFNLAACVDFRAELGRAKPLAAVLASLDALFDKGAEDHLAG
jgi:hypothetical protein